MIKNKSYVAYFTMELGLDAKLLTYSGGLGVLAGDTLKAMADIGYPVVAITMLNEKGYFKQKIDKTNNQIEKPDAWPKEKYLTLMKPKVKIQISGRTVWVRVWKYSDKACEYNYCNKLEVYYLDTNLPENSHYDQKLTSFLYGKGREYRISQEMVLGVAGVRILEKLGYKNIHKYHINEGHASFLCVELLKERVGDAKKIKKSDIDRIKDWCAFTTHTPIAAGHDKFDIDLARSVTGDYVPEEIFKQSVDSGGKFNMTMLALSLCHFVNGVAKRHEEKTREMFPGYEIHSITNGIHTRTWASKYIKKIFNTYLQAWESYPYNLRYAQSIPREEIWNAHVQAKSDLINYVFKKTSIRLKSDIMTIGFARRFTAYKRSDLIFYDLKRLKQAANNSKGLQIIMSGKAHPNDDYGKQMINNVLDLQAKINREEKKLKVVFLENYNMDIAKLLVSGCDVWLNNPQRPYEASGTSGMKAALNGVPHLSTMDGWWLEGCIEGVTGWSIGPHPDHPRFKKDQNPIDEAEDLYLKLEKKIMPVYYDKHEDWLNIMVNCISVNASFFNAYRMAQEYINHVY